jgi:excisionase family DNA binding protein
VLTVDEAAATLRVSKWSIYRLVESGQLPALRLGNGPRTPIRVDDEELERWLYEEHES